ncbi:MAG: hypothetical protein LBL83_11800, partial [Clostridiales bacterium]|nr:hypothetical protein [Clostridiales bacterium]
RVIRIVATKAASPDAEYAGDVVHANVGLVSGSEELGEHKAIRADFQAEDNWFVDTKAMCEITGDLQMTLTDGADTLTVYPIEAAGSILSCVTFLIPPNAIGDGEEWEVAGIAGIKNARDGSAVSLGAEHIDVSTYTFNYAAGDPAFGAMATDKDAYQGLETINVSLPVSNAERWGFSSNLDYWPRTFGFSCDGGESFVSESAFSWNEETQSIKAAFPAPANDTGSPMAIAIETYRRGGGGRALYGAYKIVEILPETAAFVPIESVTVAGLPPYNVPAANIGAAYPLSVQVSPANATVQGYAWTSGNPGRASISPGGTLRFLGEGRATIALTMDEAAYRAEQGLPASGVELATAYSFFVGDTQARLIADSVSASLGDGAESVTARFYDNFDSFDGDWDGAALAYEILDAGGTRVASGGAERANGVTEVSLPFGGAIPKTVSAFAGGELQPAYAIALTATREGAAPVSATANVYVAPPPITMECLAETASVFPGQQATFAFRIGDLMPGYALASDRGPVAVTDAETTPNGLTALTASVAFTPAGAGFESIAVTASSPGQESQSMSKRINVADVSADLIRLRFFGGKDGATISPEPGDEPYVFYGVRESKLAELIGYDAAGQQAAFEYLDGMTRPQRLSVVAPASWGKMGKDGEVGSNAYILDGRQIGQPQTLAWENVPTKMEFTYRSDDLSGKVYAFRVENMLDMPVSVSYENGKGQTVERAVAPYDGYVIIYEPDGISGSARMIQEGGQESGQEGAQEGGQEGAQESAQEGGQEGAGDVRFALAAARGLTRIYADRHYMEISPFDYTYSDSGHSPQFRCAAVAMSAPAATFKVTNWLRSDTSVRYGVIDRDGKFVPGTGGETSIDWINPEFRLPFGELYKNPGARLIVECQTTAERWLQYYDLQVLDNAFKNGATVPYANIIPDTATEQRTATVNSPDGETRSVDLTSPYKVITLQRGDTIDVPVVAKGEIAEVRLSIRQDKPGSDGNYTYDRTTAAPASVLRMEDWPFTPNSYATLRLDPTDPLCLTPGNIGRFTLEIKFADGTAQSMQICHGMVKDGGVSAQTVLDALKALTFFHPEQMKFRMGDAEVEKNTRNARLAVSDWVSSDHYAFFYDKVAQLYDRIEFDLAIPSQNPFEWEVSRAGDEFAIRGYANAAIVNQAGWRHWTGAGMFEQTKQDVIDGAQGRGSFDSVIGYIEGKASITPGGELQIAFYDGRVNVQSYFRYVPKDRFGLDFYHEYGIGFDGTAKSAFKIMPPREADAPASAAPFMIYEDSTDLEINTIIADNGMNLDVGMYAVKVKTHGGIATGASRRSLYRPYAEAGEQIESMFAARTRGDLYDSSYERFIDPGDGSTEQTSRTNKIWYNKFAYMGDTYLYNHLWSDEDYYSPHIYAPLEITLDRGGSFPAAAEGYGPQEPLVFTVGNPGSRPTGELRITLSGYGRFGFVRGDSTSALIRSIAPGGSGTFTLKPVEGLAAGTHTAQVTVSGENNINNIVSASRYVS